MYVQAFLDEYSLCYCGDHLPALKPHTSPVTKGKEEEEEEESDAQVLQRDIIEVTSTIVPCPLPYFPA